MFSIVLPLLFVVLALEYGSIVVAMQLQISDAQVLNAELMQTVGKNYDEMNQTVKSCFNLITMDEDQEWFGRATGALGKKQLNDVALAQRLSKLSDLISTKYWDTWAELRTNVKIVNWSWETSYDGTAHGDARIVNTLPYSISGIKYLVTYYDRSGNFMAEDDGRVSKTLNPSEKYNFTFWSSNAKYPTTANLRLDFSDKTVLELMKEKTYTGKEFAEFIKKK